MRHIRSQVEVLSKRELERIHQASLEILREVGIRVPHERLLASLRTVGAQVQDERAFIPEKAVERMLRECLHPRVGPRRWTRHDGPVQVTNGHEVTFLEHPGHNRRPGTLSDIVKGIVLTNALSTVGWALPIVVPADVPQPVAEIEAYRLGCLYSRKPFNVYFNRQSAPYLLRMAEVMALATGTPKRSLGLDFGFGIISPLRFAADDLECALLVSEAGFPAGCFSFVTVGATSPASMAGALALSNAERLACLVLMWLWGEIGGYRQGFVEDPCMLDPRTLATSFGHPNLTTLAIATSQLSRFYGLGSGGGGLALTDAKWIDYQSGFERGLGAGFCILSGGGIGNSGIVGPDEALSLEQLVIDDASLSAINWIRQGIEVTEESLALEVIKEVGIGGGFLDREHTARYLRREYWHSPVFPRQTWDDWEQSGRETLLERAHREVERILAEGDPPQPLVSDQVAERLETIRQEAWRDLVTR